MQLIVMDCLFLLQMYDKLAKNFHILEQKALDPVDVAKSIIFLASDDASRITGALLPVDDGASLSSPAYDFIGSQPAPELDTGLQ